MLDLFHVNVLGDLVVFGDDDVVVGLTKKHLEHVEHFLVDDLDELVEFLIVVLGGVLEGLRM